MNHPIGVYLAVCAGAFAAVVVLTPLCRRLALAYDVMDRPSESRKIHRRSVPYLGGLAFYAAFLCVTIGLEWFAPEYAQPSLYPMALVGMFLLLIGVYDDICGLSSGKKLVLELLLCGSLYFWGFRSYEIVHPLGGLVHVGWFAVIITALWVAGVMNAVNFSDGLDGLAAGLTGICAVAIFAVAYRSGQVGACIVMAYLVGASLGFLCFNFHPASIFMGDAGALFLGFVLGASTLMEQQKGVTAIALTVPMIVLAVPLADTTLSFYRRLMRARAGHFFQPDREHLHHRLLDLGLNQRQAVLSLYYISACMGLLAFILSGVSYIYRFLVLVLAASIVVFGVLVLQYIETLARRQSGNGGGGEGQA